MSRSLYSMLHSRLGAPLTPPERLARIEEKLRCGGSLRMGRVWEGADNQTVLYG